MKINGDQKYKQKTDKSSKEDAEERFRGHNEDFFANQVLGNWADARVMNDADSDQRRGFPLLSVGIGDHYEKYITCYPCLYAPTLDVQR